MNKYVTGTDKAILDKIKKLRYSNVKKSFKVPEVVCYKGSYISYHIAKRIINLDYISLVNLIMDREVVKELIQGEFNSDSLKIELNKILEPKNRERIFKDYYELEQKLGGTGASLETATLIYNSIK